MAANLNEFFAELHANPASALALVTDESPLSAAEAQIADEAMYAPKKLILEADGELLFGKRIGLTVRAYGRYIPQWGEEAAFYEVEDVTVGGPDGECSIYPALSWADLDSISQRCMEARP